MADALRKTTIEVDWKINNNALQRANEETDKIIAKSGRMESGYNQSASAVNNATTSIGKYNTSAKESSSNIIQFERNSKSAFNGASQGASSAKNNVVQMNNELERTGNKAVVAGGKVKNSLNATKNNVIDLTGKFGSMAEGVDSSANKVASSIERGINKPLNAAKGILVGLLATAGVAGAGTLFNAGINRLSSIEDARMSMEVMMGGDVQRADAFLNDILDFAKTTPYAFTQLSTSAKNLFAYGMDQNNIVPTLKAIGDLSAASDKGSEGIDSLAAAFGKMQVSGKASGEQLTQITEAGVPALKILANQAGVSVEEIQKQIASGKVSADTAISGLVKGIAEGTDGVAGKTQALGGVMEKLKQTWKGSLDSMKSSVTSTMATLLTPAKPKIQAGMAWFSGEFKKLPEIVENTSKMMAPAWAPTQEVMQSGKDFIKNDFVPTLKTLALTLGPGFVEGGVISLKTFAWTVDNVVKPPVLFLKEFAEEHPKAMNNIAKYATIGAAGFYAFNKVSGIVRFSTKAVDKLIIRLASIGPTAAVSSAQANASIGSIGEMASQQTIAPKARFGKLKQGTSWFFKGSAPVQQPLPSTRLEAIKAENAMLKAAGPLSASAKGTQALASTSFRLSQVGSAMKGLGSLKGFAKAIPGLSWLAAGTNLLGMNKENATDKIGGSGGMLAGGALGTKIGAGIGTLIAPGVGTAIGSAIGGMAGTAFGNEFGKRAGNWLKDNAGSMWDGLKSNAFTGGLALGIESAFKKGKKEFDKGVILLKEAKGNIEDFFGNPFETKAKAGRGLSKETAKKWNAYIADYNSIEQLHAKQAISGNAMSEQERKELESAYAGMNSKVTTEYEKKRNKSAKNIDYLSGNNLISNSVAGMAKNTGEMEFNRNKKELDYRFSILKSLEDKQLKDIEDATKRSEDRKNKIREYARNENRQLNESEKDTILGIESQLQDEIRQIEYSGQKERQEILDRQNKETAAIMSDSAKEQVILLENLKMNTGKISAKQAADVVQSSYEAKTKTIEDANEKFEKTKAILDEELHINKTITKEQYDDAIQKATDTKEGVIKEATEKHNGVVEQAKRQAEGHLEQVDWETGEVLSKWDLFKRSSVETLTAMGSELSEMWNTTGKGIVGFFDSMGQGAVNSWNWMRNSVGKIANWFIDDINNITTFFDASWKIPRMKTNYGEVATKNMNSGGFTQMQYKGSSGNYHGTALVGEEGPELAYNKTTSQARIIGQRGAEMTHINSGERVLNHKDTMKVLNGGYGEGMVLPGFANGLGGKVSDFVGSGIEKGKEIVSSAWNGAKEIGTEAMEWLDDPIGKITGLVNKHNKFSKSNTLQGLGWHSINKIGEGAKNWVQDKFDSITFGGSVDDDSMASNGVYSYLMNIAQMLMKKYGMSFTSGYRPGDPYDHGKGLAVDIALPGVTNGSPIYKRAADEASRMPGVKYVITNGMWKQRGQSWVPWPDGDHYDHVHISGEKPTGTVKGDGSVTGWRSQVQRASSFMGAGANAREVDGVLKQIQRESGGNQRITQSSAVWDVNMANGNPAQGLLQYIPSTFKAYKMRGHENILNGYHQLVAFFNNTRWRSDLPYGQSGWGPTGGRVKGYEKGGRPKVGDTVLVGENGPELFEADTAGTVHSYEKTKGLFDKTNPSIQFNPTINIEINGDVPDDTTSKIKKAVKDALEEQYAKLFGQFNSGGVV